MIHSTHHYDAQRLATNATWLAKLRWVAVAGQLTTILAVDQLLAVPLAVTPLVVALAVTALSNLVFEWWLRRQRHKPDELSPLRWQNVLGGLILLDLAVLTVMLALTGGTTNPFVIFYFVNVALTAVILPTRWAWTVCVIAVVAYGAMAWTHRSLAELTTPHRLHPLAEQPAWPLAVVGEYAAFVTSAAVIVSFLTRLTSELRQSEEARRRAEELRLRSEKLEALGTLAAGAAHELASPLSTIAVVAGEVERLLAGQPSSDELVSDMQLIRSELDRCRAILDRMATDSGQMIGEAPCQVSAAELVDAIVDEFSDGESQRITITVADDAPAVVVPLVAISQALRGLVHNALDADRAGQVSLEAIRSDGWLRLRIVDRGPGMSPALLARLGEPFFTTKQPGRGMGLGHFLARSVIERLGGRLRVESVEGQGTTVVVELPVPTRESAD